MSSLLNDEMLSIMNNFYKNNSDDFLNEIEVKNYNFSKDTCEDTLGSIDDEEKAKQNNNKCLNKDCNYNEFILDEGNYICVKCGTLKDRFIALDAEYRYYGHNDSKSSDPTRCGQATSELFPEYSLGSVIAFEYGGGKNSNDMRNLCKYQRWNSSSYKERALYNTVEHIYVSAANYGIPQTIIDEAKAMYKSLSEQTLSRGINRNGIVASCLYWALKRNSAPRSAKEISKMFNIKSTTMSRGCKIFHNTMNISVEATNAKDFILRFCSNLNLDKYIVDLCIYIVNITEEFSIVSENSPTSIACGIIFLACTTCKIDITKKQISDVNATSEVTINKCYRKLYQHRDLILPPEIIQKYSIK